MIFCICFCHVKGSPGGDRAPSVFLLMLLALTPRTITLPSGVLPELPGGAPPRLGTGLSGSSSRLVGQARHGLPRLGKDAGERASLKRGELAPRPRSKKWTSKPTECPGRHQKQRKQTECWGRKGASGMGRPQRGRRPLAEASRFPSPCSSAACHYVHSLTSVSCLLSTLPFVSVGSTFALLTKASLPPTCCLAKKGNESLVTESWMMRLWSEEK